MEAAHDSEEKEGTEPGREARDARCVEMLNTILRPVRGTLWYVREAIWKERLQDAGYDQQSERDGHPGLGLAAESFFPALSEAVPMMHGTSSLAAKGFKVRNVLSDRKPLTTFRHLGGGPLLSDFLRKTDEPCPNGMMIRRIPHKPRLNEEEMRRLDAFLQTTGIYDA